MPAFAAYRKDGRLAYIGLHENETDCWRVFLGWPSESEIEWEKQRGTRVVRIEITPKPEPQNAG